MAAVTVAIGPVPAPIAVAWCASSLSLIAAVRANAATLSIDVRPDMLDLCESLVVIWKGIAGRADPFMWSMSVEPELLEYVAQQWLEIGALTADELARIGASWAPEETHEMSDAVAIGVLGALPALGERGDALAQRISVERA